MVSLVSRISDLAIAIRDKFNSLNNKFSYDTIDVIIDGGGLLIKTGVRLDIQVPFNCVIQSWTLLADQTGSLQVDIWKCSYANYPPVLVNSITSGVKPLLSSAIKSSGVVPAGWISALSAGDIIRFNVDSISLVQRATLTLFVKRTQSG